jgi:inhibitor of KinA
MEYEEPKFRLMGDRSLLVALGDDISREVNRRVRMLYYSLMDRKLGGVVELIPSYATLLIVFDPLKISLAGLKAGTLRLMETADPSRIPEPKTVRIPVVYGGDFGPDPLSYNDHLPRLHDRFYTRLSVYGRSADRNRHSAP